MDFTGGLTSATLRNNTFKEGVPLGLLVSLDDSLKTLQLASQSSCGWTNGWSWKLTRRE